MEIARISGKGFRPNYFPLFQGQSGGSYSFSWSVNDVHSGNEFGHRETRSGQVHQTEGEYYVKLPDGRVQTVKYFVNPYSGYQARVAYEGNPIVPYPNKPFFQAFSPASPVSPVPHGQPAPFVPRPAPTSVTQDVRNVPGTFKVSKPATYRPISYKSADAQLSNSPIYNVVVPNRQHFKPHKRPLKVKPLAPPPPKLKEEENLINDPYLRSEAELQGMDFSKTLFYITTKKIVPRKKDHGLEGNKHLKGPIHLHQPLKVKQLRPKFQHRRFRFV